MREPNETYTGLVHAGAGSTLLLLQACVIIPGLLPVLALAGVLGLVLVLPALLLGLASALLALPPYLLVRLAIRGRERSRRQDTEATRISPQPSGRHP